MADRSKKLSKNSVSALIVSGAILIILAIILVLIYFMNGKTTTTGQLPSPESSESLTCRLDSLPESTILDTTNVKEGSTKVIATFTKDKLKSISILYDLYYDSPSQVESAENDNHAKINLATQKDGLGPDIFNLHFTKLTNHLEIRMYADSDEITGKSANYLLLDGTSGLKKSTIEQNYTGKGFKCTAKK